MITKRVLCAVLVAALSFQVMLVRVHAQPAGAMLVGTVVDSQGNPVGGIKVVAKDPSGKVIGEALTNNQGQYVLQNLTPGKYQLTLDPLKAPFKGETVLTSLGAKGLTVNWVVSPTAPAIATAAPGTTGAFAGSYPGFLPFAAVTGTIIGTLYGTGAIRDEHGKVGSPSL